jgi:hypothetical protein
MADRRGYLTERYTSPGPLEDPVDDPIMDEKPYGILPLDYVFMSGRRGVTR